MDEDQLRAVDLAVSGKSFFLTGAGGTGKSFVIRSIIDALRRNGKDVGLTAMTGCAALLLGKGAKTLHSWAGIGLGKESAQTIIVKIRKSFKAKKNWLVADTLIIDEVSMMMPELLDKLDEIGRGIRPKSYSKLPFGGLQVILVGDMYQLPPVNKSEERDHHFVFEAAVWRTTIQDSVILRTVHRQNDPVFLKILDEARAGRLSEESIAILETRRNTDWKKLEIKPTLLFTRRADVEQINMSQLKKCLSPDYTFKAKNVYSPVMFANKTATEQEIQWAVEKMDKNGSYVPELVLRKGAQVMLLTNMDVEHGLVNGSRGVIEEFCDSPEGDGGKLPMVKFRNGEVHIMTPATWSSEDVDGLDRQQIPLRLAYAVTIHKAQGATLDCALVDIGDNTFEYGQAYVALSRVRSLDCLYIWDLKPSAFMVHPKVKAFLDTVHSMEQSLPTPDPSAHQVIQSPLAISDQTILRSASCTDLTAEESDDPT
jgi:ATP-dependent DNA helicase PIF1